MNAKFVTILVVVAFLLAGVSVASESDGASDYQVVYKVGDNSFVRGYGTSEVVLPTLEELGATPGEDKRFVKWNTAEDGTGTSYLAGSTYIVDETEKKGYLYAILTDVQYTMTFIGYDGEVCQTYTGVRGSAVTVSDAPAVAGMNFLGWTADMGKTVYASAEIVAIVGDLTFYPVMETIYKVTWIVLDTVVSTGDTTLDSHGKYSNVNKPIDPIRADYVFTGWYDQDGQVLDGSYVISKDTVFTAEFYPVTHTVRFVYGDGQVFLTETVLHGERAIKPAELPAGYKSWAFNFASPILKDTVVEAVADVYYDVTFLKDDEVVSAISVLENTLIPSALIPAIPEGCTSWAFDFSVPITGDTEIYAVAIEYCVIDYDYLLNYIGDQGHVYLKVVWGTALTKDQIPAIDETKYVELKDKKWSLDLVGVPITADTYVKIVDVPYFEIKFMDGETVVKTLSVKEGTCVKKTDIPKAPTGMTWDIDISKPVTAAMAVKAVPLKEVYNVTFLIDGKEPVYQKSDSIAPPSTAKDGKEFQGWVVLGGDGSFVDPLTYTYKEDTTFCAVYKDAVAPAPAFWESPINLTIIILVVVAIIAGIVALMKSGKLGRKGKGKSKDDDEEVI